VGWEVKERQRYALIEQNSEDSRKHRGTFYIGPRHVKHHSTKEFAEFSYVTAPSFASEKDCRVFAQNSHVAIEVYDYYIKLFDPDYESISVYDERFIVQYEFKTGKWRDVDAYNPTIQVIPLEDGVEIRKVFDTDYGTQNLEISHIVKTGARLKHNIVFTNKTTDEKTFRVIMKLAGITHNKVRHKTGELQVTEETSIGKQPFFFIGEDNKHLKLTEYLWSLGAEEETGEWSPTVLKDIVFDVHAYGCKADIIIGNYTLGENESLLIDPDSDTWQVGAGNDDAVEYGSGSFDAANDYNRVRSYTSPLSSNYVCCGVRFTSVNIPQGSTIDSANVSLYTYSGTYDDMNGMIYGNDVDNAQDFNDNAHIISTADRPRTSASVSWVEYSIGAGVWATKSVTNIIQEIVNREGWSSNNALVLLFIANTDVYKVFRAKSYENSTTQCPKLYIEWTSGAETYTKTWQTDVLFKKLGITRTVPVDAAFKKPDIPKTYLMDVLFGKTFEKPISLDVALKRLNIPKQWMIDAAFQKAVLRTFLLDINLKKKGVEIQKQLNVLFKKLDLLKQFGVDVDFLKKDTVKTFAIDTYFGIVVTHVIQKQIDVLLRKTVITQRQVDAFFRKTLPICADVTAAFKKLDILKTFGVDTALLKNNVMKSFGVDAWFGTVCAVTYTKNFGLDVVFCYKVRLPTPLGITLDGQLVIPLKKEVWVES